MVWRTSGWSGGSTGPVGFSFWQATSAGKTAAITSSDWRRWRGAGLRRPPLKRSTASDRVSVQRQRTGNIGEKITARRSTSSTVAEARNRGTSSSGRLCWGPRESSTASSLAAAWSSKSKVAQKRLRRASPSPRLSRAPKGACTTIWVPPDSSKQRSRTIRSRVGSRPSAARPAARYATACAATSSETPQRATTPATAASGIPTGERLVDPGAEGRDLLGELARCVPAPPPARRGPMAAAPWASTTRTVPAVTRVIRHEVLPEQEDVAGHRLDRPVLVDAAHHGVVGLGHHAVVAALGDRPSRGERGQPGAPPGAQPAMDAVAVQVRAGCAPSRWRPRWRAAPPPRRSPPGPGRRRAPPAGPADTAHPRRPRHP